MKRTIKRLISLSVALVMMLSIAACGGDGSTDTSGGGSGDDINRDELVWAFISEVKELDPALTSDTYTYIALAQIFDTLVRIEEDGSIAPWLAEDWTVSDDGTEVVFKIREGVVFHNGDPLTVDDVVYSLNRAIESPQTQKFTAVFSGAEKVDEQSVKVTLPQPYAPFLYCIGNPCMAIVSQKAVEEYGEDFGRNPVGTGAYKYVDWISGEKITLTRNDDWWGEPAPIKNVTMQFYSDASTAAIALETGQIDVLYKSATSDRETLMANEDLIYYEWPSALCYHLSFNNGEESICSDPAFREAISYAINREDILLGGMDGVGDTLEFMTAPSAFGYNPDFKQNPYDPEKAKELLEAAGYPTDGSVTLRIRCNETDLYSIPGEIIQEQLRQVGITASVDKLERATYLDEVTRNFDYDISFYVITALIPDADYTMYTRLHSSMLGAGNNFTQTNIPELDAVLDQARASQDEDERYDLYTQAAEIIKESSTILPIATGMYNMVANKNLQGLDEHAIDLHYLYEYSWK